VLLNTWSKWYSSYGLRLPSPWNDGVAKQTVTRHLIWSHVGGLGDITVNTTRQMLIRTTMVTVEIHSLESLRVPAAWPAQISRTCDLLELPLPSWCSDGPYSVSPNVPKLSGAPTKPSDDLFENPCLRDCYELASHTVATVRSAMCHHGPRSTWPFVRGFTRVLAAICSQNAIILCVMSPNIFALA
jgi:hypothetical protein